MAIVKRVDAVQNGGIYHAFEEEAVY